MMVNFEAIFSLLFLCGLNLVLIMMCVINSRENYSASSTSSSFSSPFFRQERIKMEMKMPRAEKRKKEEMKRKRSGEN